MLRRAFSYDLPDELIARTPALQRSGSRLLCLDGDTGKLEHGQFVDLLEKLHPGDLMVFNDTRVIPARVFGHKASGGKLEIMVERILDEQQVLAHIRASKSPKADSTIELEDGTPVKVLGRVADLFHLAFPPSDSALDVLNRIGHMPLPPYIDRADELDDRERYQTVYARNTGAVAAPTAGLHFDQQMLERIQLKGVQIAFVTLHVGAGTFVPVRCDNIADHKMHSEYMTVAAEVCDRVAATRANGKRVIAVGTTSVRCLETAAASGSLQPFCGETDIFIYPGKDFKVVDALVTNFHLSESTLLMLVCAFAGYQRTLDAYRTAVALRYRFFSYGDAMWLTRNPNAGQDLPPDP